MLSNIDDTGGRVRFRCIVSPRGFVKKPYGIARKRTLYIKADTMYPERVLFATLYSLLSDWGKREIQKLFDGKMSAFFDSFYKGIPTVSPFPPVSSYLIVKMIQLISGNRPYTLYVDIGTSPFYFLVMDTLREARRIASKSPIELYLVSAYDIPLCRAAYFDTRAPNMDYEKHAFYLRFFVAGHIWKKFLVSVYGQESEVADFGEWLDDIGLLGRESIRDIEMVKSVLQRWGSHEIDMLAQNFWYSDVADRVEISDTLAWLYSFIDKAKSDFYKKLSLIYRRNHSEYQIALARGIEVLGDRELSTEGVFDMEIIKLANAADYYPREVKKKFRVYRMKKPFTVFHTYMWGARNLKPISHLPAVAYGLLAQEDSPYRRLYLSTVLLKSRYLHNMKHDIGEQVLLKLRNEILDIVPKLKHAQKDIILHAGISAGTSFASKYPDASVAIMRDMVYKAKEWKMPSLEASALNNMATAIMRMDVSQAMVRGLYEDAIMVILASGGGSMLLPIVLNNYSIHMIGSRNYDAVKRLNRITAMLFPQRKFFSDVLSIFLNLINGYDVREELLNLTDLLKRTPMINKRRFAEFLFYQMIYVTRNRDIIEVLVNYMKKGPIVLLYKAMSGEDVSIDDIGHISELFTYRLLFEKYISAKDWTSAILYGEKLASAHLRYGNMLFHGTVKEWLGDIYLKVGEEEKASLSFSRAVYIYETLGYSSKTCKVLDKMGIRHRKWDSPLKGAIFGVLEESLRKDINLDLITSLSSEVDMESLFRSSLWHLANFLPFWQGFVALYNGDDIEYLYSMDISGKRDIPLDEFHQCRSTGKFVVYGSCMDASFPVSYNRILKVHIERPFGGKEFTSGQRLLFEEFVSSLSSVTSSVLVKERGIVDSLTGVYTRWYIVRRLEELINTRARTGEDVSVLFIDVDNFKMVNDIYGHRIGDMVLKKIAYAIKDSVRSTDMVGRYGGDEFIVIMPATDIDKSLIVAHRIIDTVKKYLSDIEEAVGVSVSIGISSTRLCREISPQILIESADKAMYMSKKAGKSRATIYDGS